MNLFDMDGHLTDAGLRSIIEGGLDELQSLEASEHLAFCDTCLLRYTALLEADVLVEPEVPLRAGVMKRIRRRGAKIAFSRYATVAAAAVLAMGIWLVGSRAGVPKQGEGQSPEPPAAEEPAKPEQSTQAPRTGISDRLSAAFGTAVNGMEDFFSALLPKPTEPEAPKQPEPERQPRRGQKDNEEKQTAGDAGGTE